MTEVLEKEVQTMRGNASKRQGLLADVEAARKSTRAALAKLEVGPLHSCSRSCCLEQSLCLTGDPCNVRSGRGRTEPAAVTLHACAAGPWSLLSTVAEETETNSAGCRPRRRSLSR